MYILVNKLKTLNVINFKTNVHVLHWNIDQTVVNSLHSWLNFKIGGLDHRVITTEYIPRYL